jgi:hypothetical protein
LADQWLNLREIDFTAPDTRLYREFDESLKQSMILETHAFLAKLIDEDLPTRNFVHSNFAMLNERLAKHYRIPGITHEDIRPVRVKPEYHRGGVITQGAVLKVTANGTTTSPVVRGAWINERLLGVEIPTPPDNVPAIEPDIRGAKSIRDQLEKHSSDPGCASCHIKIDPPGFALENFDVIGGWRTTYRTANSRDPKLPVNPESNRSCCATRNRSPATSRTNSSPIPPAPRSPSATARRWKTSSRKPNPATTACVRSSTR